MRSRTSQARALFRILSASSGSSAAATTSASASTSATASTASQVTRPTTAFKRRRNIAATAVGRAGSKSDNHRTIYIRASPLQSAAKQSVISGLKPVHPPPASIATVATQIFFASGRPLLEHQVIVSRKGTLGSSSELGMKSEDDGEMLDKVKTTIDNARDAIMEAASQASKLSPEELSRTLFVVTGVSETGKEPVWPVKVHSISHDRFTKLIDRLSTSQSGLDAVEEEAEALEAEEAHKRDVKEAIASALDRGVNPSAARKLGSEAELVVLGEPNGPSPEWPRGVASYIVENTRALEPPPAPIKQGETDMVEAMERMDIEDLAKHFTGSENAFQVQNVSDNDANLLLNHAMVQAILPARLRWDAVVAKMDQASNITPAASSQVVDWSIINADSTPTEDDDCDEVHMDSVKRKRRKKMRKHKYRKFRKATRVERNRLKK